jgi:hypothetical protein
VVEKGCDIDADCGVYPITWWVLHGFALDDRVDWSILVRVCQPV